MSNIYDMSGKKKVLFTEEPKTKLTYKEIMAIIIKYAKKKAVSKYLVKVELVYVHQKC